MLALKLRSHLSGFTYLCVWFRSLTSRSPTAQFFEDQTLQLSPLPVPAPVQLPAGLPSQLFGEAVMVTEFVHAYSPLLVPAGGAPLPLDQLLPALAGSAPHHKLLLDVVTMMLKVLLSDQTSEVRRRSYGGGGGSGRHVLMGAGFCGSRSRYLLVGCYCKTYSFIFHATFKANLSFLKPSCVIVLPGFTRSKHVNLSSVRTSLRYTDAAISLATDPVQCARC